MQEVERSRSQSRDQCRSNCREDPDVIQRILGHLDRHTSPTRIINTHPVRAPPQLPLPGLND